MALPKNRQAILDLIGVLESEVLGKQLPGFSCDCGALNFPAAYAAEILPGGGENPGSEASWLYWSVRMTPLAKVEGQRWRASLSSFIKETELDRLFDKFFPAGQEENPYKLDSSGEKRLIEGLSLAAQIMETEEHIRIQFDFGADQAIANKLQAIMSSKIRIDRTDDLYDVLIQVLGQLTPVVYVAGPPPQLPHEPKWWESYEEFMRAVHTGQFERVSFGGYSLCGNGNRSLYLDMPIFFHK